MNVELGIVLSFISGLVGSALVAYPMWRKTGAEKRKIEAERIKIEAETESISVSTLKETLAELKTRISMLEEGFERKVNEVQVLNDLLAEKDRRIKILGERIDTLIAIIRSFIGIPKNDNEREVLRLLDEMEEETI